MPCGRTMPVYHIPKRLFAQESRGETAFPFGRPFPLKSGGAKDASTARLRAFRRRGVRARFASPPRPSASSPHPAHQDCLVVERLIEAHKPPPLNRGRLPPLLHARLSGTARQKTRNCLLPASNPLPAPTRRFCRTFPNFPAGSRCGRRAHGLCSPPFNLCFVRKTP